MVTPERDLVLDAVVEAIAAQRGPRTLVAVDGRSGAGKSTFADEVAARLRSGGRSVVRSTTDSFHRPRADRLRRGGSSADGYYLDSHQLDVVVDELLTPFASGATHVRTAAFDEPSDAAVEEVAPVATEAVLVFDGLFLQRPELVGHWDLVVFLEADRRRDEEWLTFLLDGLPEDPSERADALDARLERARWPRYRAGWRAYVDAAQPAERATLVVDNNDLRHPRLRRSGS